MENNSKILSELTLSSNSSFQSNSESTIECCICGETVNNENSFMPNCKHSWCKDCNKKLNNNNINNCPICKLEFKSKLRKGKWKLHKNDSGFYFWEWEIGEEDSKRKIRIKKLKKIFYNFGLFYSNSNYDYSINGISV